MDFAEWFQGVFSQRPLFWQTRLYQAFVKKEIPEVIDLPTGLGKTMVMAIWWFAREKELSLPRRLIYVVDRRTVVDQATDLAERIRDSLGHDKLTISTLRGQLADNREWARDPSKPAIVIGTVDLIGSALLFSAYRNGYKTKPLYAGLLGQDALLVLDEAHLSKPFEQLIRSIATFQSGQGSPVKVIRMSATGSATDTDVFGIKDSDSADAIIEERFTASKSLSISTLGEKDKRNEKLAEAAIELAKDSSLKGKRIVVFVRSPNDAVTIANEIRDHTLESTDTAGSKPKKVKTKPYAESVEALTGTMRGLERDELIDKPVMKRFFDGAETPGVRDEHPVFLISTSAGEVGFDLNADHMVCDATTLDSLVQRLGRVNRRGKGKATIRLFVEAPKKDKDGKLKKLSAFELACAKTVELLQQQLDLENRDPDPSPELANDTPLPAEPNPRAEKTIDVSPRALTVIKKALTSDELKAASTPEPATVDLTDILLDAWSMTSIVAPMPGRPEVAPWLRGIADELPQTTIAWREELDQTGFDQLELEEIEEWFDTHRILTHETLTVPTHVAAKAIKDRWSKLEARQSDMGQRPVLVDRSGLKHLTVKELIHQLSRNSGDETAVIRNADLILPASFGGIERGKGMLDPNAPEDPKDADKQPTSPDVADERGERYRELIARFEGVVIEEKKIGTGNKQEPAAKFVLELEADEDKRVQLISYVPKREKLELGSSRQSLAEHVGLVRKHLGAMLQRIELPSSIKRAAELAADFHDHGKNRDRWQRCVGRRDGEAPLGKSGGEMKRDPRGYRHEFGSLREFVDAFNAGKLLDHASNPLTLEIFDLAAHLIATHHGRGRPHFPKGGFDPDAEERSEELHSEAIRRFGRLQRKYGWWYLAWLENLLRCADAMASAIDETSRNCETTA